MKNPLKHMTTLLGISLLSLQSFAANPYCTVKGKISGLTKDSKIIVAISGGDHGADHLIQQAPIKADGNFSFSLPETVGNQLYDFRIEGIRSAFSFVAEKGEVEISADVKKFYAAEIKGTPENNRWNNYQKFMLQSTMKSNEINMSGNKYSREEKVAFFNKIGAEKKAYVDSLAKNYPNSVVALYLTKGPLMMMKYNEIDAALKVFTPYFAKHPYYIAMKKRADVLRKVAPGAIAPDFNVVQPDGKSKISLSSFRGKYVMLDFWASWCVPCRAENPHTRKVFEKYNSLGLEVISFSLDHEIKPWNEAIAKDGMIWKHASDLVGGVKSPVAQRYGIDGIPAIWIIDPSGKIIAEGLRGEALDKFLESTFASKTKG
uniref:TlpA disulfide reductase family protein n=1 Tax=Pedobacter schmidteae TaxID=2201271 RepID=UPI000EB4FE87|nr:TlpA disulfide reductase family protein [Pedobacter schmidteae]